MYNFVIILLLYCFIVQRKVHNFFVAATLPCTDDVTPCGDTCGRLLSCGRHKCTQRCHQGACGSCMQVMQRLARIIY
jgi:hypothetical protein